MTEEEIRMKSKNIFSNIIKLTVFNASRTIALYSPVKNEVDTWSIFDYAIDSGKRVAFPRVEDGTLVFCAVKEKGELIKGKYNILEPPSEGQRINTEEIEIFLIPGVAFDRLGYRIGYGYGYYDSIAKRVRGTLIGLAYSFQVVDSIFHEEHDIRVNSIVTEDGVIECVH